MKLYSRHQGGWIAKFVIVGVALLLALLLGVYFLRSQAKSPQGQLNQPSSTKNDTSKSTSSDKGVSDNKSSVDQALPSASNQSDQSANSTTNSANQQTADSNASTGAVGVLPHTGPETTIAQLAVIAMLAFVATLYIRSRRIV